MSSSLWSAKKSFYDQLTLEKDGDSLEQEAATRFGFGAARFQHYLYFWRHHVAPATCRPESIRWRTTADNGVGLIGQHSYSVFYNLFSAYHYRLMAAPEAPGESQRRYCFTALMHAGNALQVVEELLMAAKDMCNDCWRLSEAHNPGGLPRRPGPLFGKPDEKGNFQFNVPHNKRHEALSKFRNVLTHHGIPHTAYERSGDREIPMICPRDLANESSAPNIWPRSQERYEKNRNAYRPLPQECDRIIADTTDWLDTIYRALVSEMDILLEYDGYIGRLGIRAS
jgi:hypothetical protein